MQAGRKITLRLLGRDIEVEFFDKKLPIVVEETPDDSEALGVWSEWRQKIQVQAGSHPDFVAHTLCHEIMHAYDDLLKMGMSHKKIDQVGQAVYDLIKNNLHFVVMLIKEDKIQFQALKDYINNETE